MKSDGSTSASRKPAAVQLTLTGKPIEIVTIPSDTEDSPEGDASENEVEQIAVGRSASAAAAGKPPGMKLGDVLSMLTPKSGNVSRLTSKAKTGEDTGSEAETTPTKRNRAGQVSSQGGSESPQSAAKKARIEEERKTKLQARKEQDLQREEKRKQLEKEKEEKRKQLEREKEERKRQAEREREEKRRKLEKEKEERRKAQEEKKIQLEREREEKRRAIEEEKLRKQAAKDAKEREREEKRKAAEEERKQKEEEKKRKQESQEKSQLRLSNFFAARKPIEHTSEEEKCYYDKMFLDFYVKSNVEMIPRGILPPEKLAAAKRDFEEGLTRPPDPTGPDSMLAWLKGQRKSSTTAPPTCRTADDIVQAMNGGEVHEDELVEMLKQVPRKYISFDTNVRPPYSGTFSKPVPRGVSGRNPFCTEGTGLNYDYDSDLEWVAEDEEEEGEDIDLEDEEEDLEEDSDDMDGFVDEEEDENPRKRRVIGQLVPVVKWNDGVSDQPFFAGMALECLLVGSGTPIDPFRDYWSGSRSPQKGKTDNGRSEAQPGVSGVATNGGGAALETGPKKKSGKTTAKITDIEHLRTLAQHLSGSDFNQIMLVEILKRELPMYPKDVIRNSIKQYGKRETVSSTRKIWHPSPELKNMIAG